MLPQSYPNYKTVHRRFQTWCCTTYGDPQAASRPRKIGDG
jgi:hypothetical protein